MEVGIKGKKYVFCLGHSSACGVFTSNIPISIGDESLELNRIELGIWGDISLSHK